MLGHDILGTYDASGSNIFITKYDDGDSTKLMMGNMWDFDTIEMVEDDFSKVHTFTGGFITNPLFSSNNETFTQAYKDKWEELRPTIFNQIEQFLKDFASSDIARALEESRVLDFNRWSITGPTVALNIISNIHWFKKRKFWLDRAIGNIVTDINNKNIEPEVSVNQYYNLHGQPISDKAKGLVITKGRKYMNR